MPASSHTIDRIDVTFNGDNAVADAGLLLTGTLLGRLGLDESATDEMVWRSSSGLAAPAAIPPGRARRAQPAANSPMSPTTTGPEPKRFRGSTPPSNPQPEQPPSRGGPRRSARVAHCVTWNGSMLRVAFGARRSITPMYRLNWRDSDWSESWRPMPW